LFVSGRLHYRNVPAPGGEDGSLMVRHTNILAEIVQVIARGKYQVFIEKYPMLII
jgi:hypothetical protein